MVMCEPLVEQYYKTLSCVRPQLPAATDVKREIEQLNHVAITEVLKSFNQ